MLSLLGTYMKFLSRYLGWFLVFWISLVSFAVLESIQPYFFKLIVDSAELNGGEGLVGIVVIFGVVKIGGLLASNMFRAAGDKVVLPASRDVRMMVVNKIHDLDFAYHTSRSTGSLISIIKRGDGAFFDFFQNININLSRILIDFVVMCWLMFGVRWGFGLIMLSTFGLAILVARRLIVYNLKTRKEFNETEDVISEIIVDNLINFETVKLFAKEKWEASRLKQNFKTWMEKLWEYAISFRKIDLTVGGLGNCGIVVTLVYGVYLLRNSTITTGDFIMVAGLATSFYGKFFELIYNLRNVAKNMVDIQKYFAVLDEKSRVADPIEPIRIGRRINGEIEFKNVGFTYPENNKNAVVGINLKIGAGQSVALVGSSGVGKTTLVKLLLRYFDPETGLILVDGMDIKKLKKSDLRSIMGVVPQEPIMFNNTIGYNIGYGQTKYSQREIEAAAKMANLAEFIETLPKKYETSVGERGVKLSGGQKQRLAIARMILKNPDIIIFDEATSQLDSASEKLIQDAFWQAAKNKTAIIIAHRLSTIIRAEKIVVMEKGRIAEMGTHRQLVADKAGLYNSFWKLQTTARG